MVSSLGLTKMNHFVGGVLNHAALCQPHAYKPSKSLIRNMKNMIIGLQ